MFATEFLPAQRYYQYGDWLQNQDADTQQLYFGAAGGRGIVESLMDCIEADPSQHEILVAQNGHSWVGTLHIAKITSSQVEFGIIVHKDHRGQGIANDMLEEAIVWARNRGYRELFMHCVGWNRPIRHLCQKHGLLPRNMLGDSEVNITLNPPSWTTMIQEAGIKQRNVYHTFLQNTQFLFQELYG